MEENNNKRKIIIPMALGIAVLTILVLGATYAYFTVGTSNNFGSKTITATTPEIGSVTLSSGDSLSLNMTSELMMPKWTDGTNFYNSEAECEAENSTPGNVNSKLETYEVDNLMPKNEAYKPSLMTKVKGTCSIANNQQAYYATTTGIPSTTPTTVGIAIATVTGKGNFNCTYDLTITPSSTSAEKNLYTAFTGMTGHDADQIVLKVGSHTYDFNTTDFSSPITIQETFKNLTSSASQSIKASLMFNNTNFDQNDLQGKDITFTFTASNLSCTAIEAPNVLYYTYDANAEANSLGSKITTKLASPDATWQYYIKERSTQAVAGEDTWAIFDSGVLNTSYGTFAGQSACQTFINGAPSTITCGEISGETYQTTANEACAIFNGEEVCLKPNDYANVDSYYTRMNNLGLTCNDYQNTDYLRCSNGTTYNEPGSLFCNLSDDGIARCGLLGGSRCTVFDSSYAVCEM